MRSTSGSRTCSIMPRIRLRRARASRPVWTRSTSSIWRPTRHHRIERGHRFLKDHRHGGGAQLPQPPVTGAKKFLADQSDAAAERRQRSLCSSPSPSAT